jgi:hypothetical protein
MIDDPIVDEVRRYRQENAAKFGYDVRAIAEDARKREKTSGHRIVNLQEIDNRPKPARKPRKPAHPL